MNALAISIVHPAYENLKKVGRLLHLVAALLIIVNAFNQFHQPKFNHLYFWCQLIIALDIAVIVFTSRNILLELPKVNLAFRLIECVIFTGAASMLLLQENWVLGIFLTLIAACYFYIFYCERKAALVEMVAFNHIGITISGLPSSRFFLWANINHIDAGYDRITIETSTSKIYHFTLRRNLQFEELDRIHDFCRHYLGHA
ncbi:MAG: hypothetical protein H7Y27_08365 [Gemmatimonadaceae bacterium]|nr:hypothetical protein [Chitinophagaceae bacterium]